MQDFTSGNITKSIVLFSFPMLIGNVFQQLYNMADAVIVGRYVGGTALAAVGVAGTVLNFLLSVLIGLATGSSVVVSQYYGAKQEDNLRLTVSTTLIFLSVLSFIITVLGLIFMPGLMQILRVQDEVFADTVTYLRILAVGVFVQMLFNVYSAFMRALGDSRTPLICLTAAIVLNIVLDIWFVAGLGWGVAGAAIATVLAQVMAIVPCLFYVMKKVPMLNLKRFVFDREIFSVVLRYSIPAALQLSMVSLASLSIMRLVNEFGSNATAGYTTATKIDQMALLPGSSISMAASSFVGQNMGAGLEERAKKGLVSTGVFMFLLAIAVSVGLLLFGRPLMALFMEKSDANYEAIVTIGVNYISITAAFYFLFAILFAFNGFFRGAGDAVIVMCLTVSSLIIRSVAAYILVRSFGMGPEAVAWSTPIGWAIASLAAFIYYKKNLWAGKSAVRHAEVTE